MVKAAAAGAAIGDMPSFEEDAVRVEKPEVALPLDDMEAEKWKKDDDVQLLEPPKVDDAGQDVNPFSALNSQMSKVKISQTEATYPPAREGQETWRAFDISTTSTENDALDDTKQEEAHEELDSVEEGKVSSTGQHEDQEKKEMDVVEQDEGGKEKQEKKVKVVQEHEEAKEKKSKEKKEKKADGEDKKEKKEKKEKEKKEKKEKKDKKEKNDVDTLIKKLEKMDGKIERILAKKQQYEQQLKEAKERKLQIAENKSVPSE